MRGNVHCFECRARVNTECVVGGLLIQLKAGLALCAVHQNLLPPYQTQIAYLVFWNDNVHLWQPIRVHHPESMPFKALTCQRGAVTGPLYSPGRAKLTYFQYCPVSTTLPLPPAL